MIQKFTLLLCLSYYLYADAQSFYPTVINMPVTGYQQIYAENPYILGLTANQSEPGQWIPEIRTVRTQAPNINHTGLEITSSWANDTWMENEYSSDSFILDDQNRILTVFEINDYNYPNYTHYTKAKHQFYYNATGQVSQIEYYETPNKTSNTYARISNVYFTYNANGARIKDSSIYTYSTTPEIILSYYQYEGTKLIMTSQIQGTDTTGKTIYTYSGDNMATTVNYRFDTDADEWNLNYSDSFEYNEDNRVSRRKSSGFIFDNGNVSFGPYRNETYTYTTDAKLSEMIERLWDGTEWYEWTKTLVHYTNGQATTADQFQSDGNGGWKTNANYQYRFQTPTGLSRIAPLSGATFHLYPNPASGLIQVNIQNPTGSIELYDANGKLVYAIRDITSSQSLNLSDYPDGIYCIRHVSQAGDVSQQKLVISH